MSVAEQKIIEGKLGGGSRLGKPRSIVYPESDGKPLAETVQHRDAIMYAIQAAQVALAALPDAYISGNDFIYYVEGDPTKRVSPDCYILLDLPPRPQALRRSFKIWEEGKAPNVVFEFTSPKTRKQDREEKFDLYENTLKVAEYFLFDPLNQYLRPRLQGYRLTNGAYQPIVPDADGRMLSAETGIRLFTDNALLRFIHPKTGEVILTHTELDALKEQETQRANAETQRANAEAGARQEAEVEIARLKAELARLRGQG